MNVYSLDQAKAGEELAGIIEHDPHQIDMIIEGKVHAQVEAYCSSQSPHYQAAVLYCRDVFSGRGAIVDEGSGFISFVGTGEFFRVRPTDHISEELSECYALKITKSYFYINPKNWVLAIMGPNLDVRYFLGRPVPPEQRVSLEYLIANRMKSFGNQ